SPDGNYRIETKNALIADTVGINVRTLYRALNQLKSEGLLSVVKGCIVVTGTQLQEIKKRCI
ncbi:MAG: Crp/Fnr family transcriptional regulator, partial [Pseudoflavonifractor sp.]